MNQFLFDIDSVVEEVPDSRPEYENKSSGFLKLRRLNQSILIKGTAKLHHLVIGHKMVLQHHKYFNTTGGTLFTYGNPMMKPTQVLD